MAKWDHDDLMNKADTIYPLPRKPKPEDKIFSTRIKSFKRSFIVGLDREPPHPKYTTRVTENGISYYAIFTAVYSSLSPAGLQTYYYKRTG